MDVSALKDFFITLENDLRRALTAIRDRNNDKYALDKADSILADDIYMLKELNNKLNR